MKKFLVCYLIVMKKLHVFCLFENCVLDRIEGIYTTNQPAPYCSDSELLLHMATSV